jgi:hypothetical protein
MRYATKIMQCSGGSHRLNIQKSWDIASMCNDGTSKHLVQFQLRTSNYREHIWTSVQFATKLIQLSQFSSSRL